jgi:hypothetical protein
MRRFAATHAYGCFTPGLIAAWQERFQGRAVWQIQVGIDVANRNADLARYSTRLNAQKLLGGNSHRAGVLARRKLGCTSDSGKRQPNQQVHGNFKHFHRRR